MDVQIFVQDLDVPWEMAFAPDGRVFITERAGTVRTVKDGRLEPDPWVSLPVAAVGEGGLMGLAIPPGISGSLFLYAAYTYRSSDGALHNQLVRISDDPSTGKGAMDRNIFDNVVGGSVHDGGRVKLGPDGKIYWTTGEAGIPELSQNLTAFNGKVLRINPDGSIPDDNPFKGSPVYSYGHRNSEGLAWQPGTGRLYETEHGPSGGSQGVGQDEINYIEPGKNYGWPTVHGEASGAGFVSPILQSGNSETWAPSGATFVKGGPWDGSLLFAGLRGESLYRITLDPVDPIKVIGFEKLLTQKYGRLRDVVQGPDGAIYVLTNNRDGRGQPFPGDDKILRLTFK
jgi:aldose sugar dehydrogenase